MKIFLTFSAPSQLFLPLGIPAPQLSSHDSIWSSMEKHDLINMEHIPAVKQKSWNVKLVPELHVFR